MERRRNGSGIGVVAGLEVLICELSTERVALLVRDVLEIVHRPAIAPVVRPRAGVIGLLDLRGQVLRVLDLERSLGGPPWPRDVDGAVVVCARHARDVGLLVRDTRGVHRVALGALETDASELRSRPHALAVFEDAGARIVILDLRGILRGGLHTSSTESVPA